MSNDPLQMQNDDNDDDDNFDDDAGEDDEDNDDYGVMMMMIGSKDRSSKSLPALPALNHCLLCRSCFAGGASYDSTLKL